MRIAMWSGPRNISTAMMYAFGNRQDFAVWDEPFYAAYLSDTDIDHPLKEEVIENHESNAETVAKACVGNIPDQKENFYMKHMPFHMLKEFPMDWANSCFNAYLIRHPARVIASYAAKRENPTLRDIGFLQQVEMFEKFPGPVFDSDDIRANPEKMMRKVCREFGLRFDEAMLAWEPGPKHFDGAWAPHWYGAVHNSTGFANPEGPLPELKNDLAELCNLALPLYERLAEQKVS